MRSIVAAELAPFVEAIELLAVAPRPVAMTRVWRQQTAEAAVRRALELQSVGRHLLLAGDPVPAIEIVAAPSADKLEAIAVCLLDADAESQAERLSARGDDKALLPHHQAFAEWMREQALDPMHITHVVSNGGWAEMRWDRLPPMADHWDMHTIDTSHLAPPAVALAVLDWCQQALTGGAPVLRLPAE